MLVAVEHEAGGHAAERPARERARRLLDVALRVVSNPHREQLEQLAGEVLVRLALHIPHPVEPHQHRGVFGDLQHERLEVVQPQPLKPLDLDEHQPARLHFGGGSGEVVVPKQRHAFLNRLLRDEHAVEPPRADRLRLQVVLLALQNAQYRLVVDTVVVGAFQQPIDCAFDAQRNQRFNLAWACAEARTPPQMRQSLRQTRLHRLVVPHAMTIMGVVVFILQRSTQGVARGFREGV
jgi:hypothetical protein